MAKEIPIDRIRPGKYQPRKYFSQTDLNELADSIEATDGLIQPIVVRPITAPDADYEILAGERRWRAVQILLRDTIPADVRECSDEQALKISLIENIQRQELDPIEEAEGLERLSKEFNLTHEEIAGTIGRSREGVTNALRLLKLDASIQFFIHEKKLDAGHGKILASLDPNLQKMLGREAAYRSLTVDQLSARVKQWDSQSKPKKPTKESTDPDTSRLLREFTTYIGARTEIRCDKNGQGFLKIHFSSINELQGIFQRSGFNPEEGAEQEKFCDDIVVIEKNAQNKT